MLFAEIARMRRGEAHAADARDSSDVVEQRGEIPARGRRIAVAVHVLSQQLDLGVAGARQLGASAITDALVRLRSGPRVNGTTQ